MQLTTAQLTLVCYCMRGCREDELGTNGHWQNKADGGRSWSKAHGLLKTLHETLKYHRKMAEIDNKYRDTIQIHCKSYLKRLEGVKNWRMNSAFIKSTIQELKNIIQLCKSVITVEQKKELKELET